MKRVTLAILALFTLNLSSAFAQDTIRLIGSAGGISQCELQLRGDFEQDAEGFSIKNAAIKNGLTNFQPLAFGAYIENSGHVSYVSLGAKVLELNLDEELNIIGYTFTSKRNSVYCNLEDAEVIANF